MECIVKRVSTTQNSTIISHSDKKDHKYIAKVKRKNGKYRYFYDKKEYQEYLNDKKSSNGIIDKLDNWFDDINDRRRNFQKQAKKKVNKILNKYNKRSVKDFMIDKRTINKAKKFVDDLFDKTSSSITGGEKKQSKYIAKVELSNGKYRYFYKQSEYDAYLKRLEYQKNEPDFMKDVPDISNDKVYTAKEDMEQVNETYDPFDPKTSTNCGNCSAAYELRRRGYDVEAKANGGTKDYNGNGDRVFDYFENATMFGIYGDGTTIEHSEEFVRGVWNGGVDKKFLTKYDNLIKYMNKPQTYTKESIEKGITSNSPPGSRGMIDVEWKQGGGHSIVYEVNKNGNVIIRDSQTYDVYSLDEIANNVQKVRISRTDNLQLKEDILSAVVPNESNERDYYVDKGRTHTKLD